MDSVAPDPLCRAHDDGWQLEYMPPCICRLLATARLQGPVKAGPRHAPFCWCPRCVEASNAIHGTDA